MRLNRLAPQHVQKLVAAKTETGLSPRTVEYIWMILKRALGVAVQWGLVTRNVVDLTKPPRPTRREVTPLTIPEMNSVLNEARTHRLGAAFVLALTTGMRRGEVLGLHWDDIDLEVTPARLRVRRSLQRVNGELVETEPKSAKSRRTVSLTTIASESLGRHRAAQAADRLAAGEHWADRDLVFTTQHGTPIEPRNFLRQWHRILEQVGLDPRPLHEARHAAASLMLSEGVPLKVVQETLGHSTITLTADTYGHLMPDDGDRVAQTLDRALGA